VGPRPVDDATRRCRELRARARGNLRLEATIDSVLGVLEAMQGSLAEARRLCRRSSETFDELGLKIIGAGNQLYAGLVELIAGDPVVAEHELRRGYEALERVGERAWLSTLAGLLARALYLQGRHDEAEQLTAVSEGAAAEDDIGSQVLWRGTRAKVLASRGQHERGEQLAREAVELARRTDFMMQADAVSDLADVLLLKGRQGEAARVLEEALRLYDAKGNVVCAAAIRERLTTLAGARSA
jgi:tetratricopeptide (TPR) repeat protein